MYSKPLVRSPFYSHLELEVGSRGSEIIRAALVSSEFMCEFMTLIILSPFVWLIIVNILRLN